MQVENYLYFAYGSNMNPERIRQRIPEARALGRATLYGWRLVERLYADIERARGRRVEGVLYAISQSELRRLDAYEGYPTIYSCQRVTVHAALMGVENSRFRVPAFTYAMTESTRKEREGKPYPESYRMICALGAQHWKIPNAPFGKITPKNHANGWFEIW